MTYQQPVLRNKVLNPACLSREDINSYELLSACYKAGQMKGDFLCLQFLATIVPPRA